MPEHSRRPPPGKSFPFLRKGDGQKTKIKYPVLKRAENLSKSVKSHTDSQLLTTEGESSPHYQSKNLNTSCQNPNSHEIDADPNGQYFCHLTVDRKTENESNQKDGGSTNNIETLSSSEEESTTPSSIAQSNIELRKRALPLQKWSRKQDYSLPIPAADSSSPVLASTPQPVSEKQISAIQPTLKKHSLQPSQRMVALETPILGDVTNQLDEAILPSRCQLRDPSHFHVANIANKDVSEEVKQNYTANDELNTTSRSVARHDPAIHDKIRSIRQKGYVDVETKLVEQLRNAIAHLDLADIELQRKARDLEEAYVKFRDDVREFEEEKETEKERVLRLRRQLERERKLLNKDGAERDKAIAEQIEDLMKVITQKDQKISSLRLQLRKSEESEQAKEKDLENSNKRIERLERNVNTLQRQLAQIRGNYAKQSREMAAELQAARTHNLRRKQSIGLLQCTNGEITNREAAVVDSLQDPEKVVSREKSAQERSKSVTWADKDVPGYTLTPIPLCEKDCNELKFSEEGLSYFGFCRLFRNGIGDWTKITTTDCGCDMYEYSNSDVRWICCDRTVEVNYFGIIGATVVTLLKGCSIRYFNNGQIEVYRLSGEISRFDPVTRRRTETMLDSDGLKYVEIFDSNGSFLRLEGSSCTSHKFGERSSYRGCPSDRHVYNHNNFEPEWIEPEYNARRCPDGSLKIKLASIMICCLGVEDVGYVKHTTRLENGSERKRMCVEWGHVARARQRQIETRKCQQLTALNATM